MRRTTGGWKPKRPRYRISDRRLRRRLAAEAAAFMEGESMKRLLLAVAVTTAIVGGCDWLKNLPLPPGPPTTTTTTTTTLPPSEACPPGTHWDGSACVSDTPEPPQPRPCPAEVPMSARVMKVKPYGQGYDSTVRVNDQAYCAAVTGDPSITSCKAKPEGSDLDLCDQAALGGIPCPIWQWSVDGKTWQRCRPEPAEMSCDHFEHWKEYDPPYKGRCEKRANGFVISGWFTIVHGKGKARACTADDLCTDPVAVDY